MQHAALLWGLQLLLVAKCSSDHLYQLAVVTAVEILNSSELFCSSLYCRQAVSQSSFSMCVFQNFLLFSIFPYYSFLFCDMFPNCCSHIHLGLPLGHFPFTFVLNTFFGSTFIHSYITSIAVFSVTFNLSHKLFFCKLFLFLNLLYSVCFFPSLLHFFKSHPIYNISNDKLCISPLAVPKLWIAEPLVICRSLQRVWGDEGGRKTRIKKERKKEKQKEKKLLVTDILYQYCNKNSQE